MSSLNSGIACVICGASELHTAEVSAGGGLTPSLLPIGVLHSPRFRLKICVSCGHTRWFVPSDLLPKVREQLAKLPVAPQ